jgi:hypothetical protein
VRLIQDLRGDIGVNDEGVGVILDLIDKCTACAARWANS